MWVLDEILLLLNNIDAKIIKESLSYKMLSILNKRDANLNDPFLYFYEEFEVYDKNTKVDAVYFIHRKALFHLSLEVSISL